MKKSKKGLVFLLIALILLAGMTVSTVATGKDEWISRLFSREIIINNDDYDIHI